MRSVDGTCGVIMADGRSKRITNTTDRLGWIICVAAKRPALGVFPNRRDQHFTLAGWRDEDAGKVILGRHSRPGIPFFGVGVFIRDFHYDLADQKGKFHQQGQKCRPFPGR